MQQLHDLIDELQAERDLIDKRIELAAALLNTYDPLEANDLALGDEVVRIVGRTTAPTPTVEPRVACPDCGQTFDRRGLGPHRSKKHPESAAKPIELRPVPTFDPDAARARAAAAI
jgi:hypothetical protein